MVQNNGEKCLSSPLSKFRETCAQVHTNKVVNIIATTKSILTPLLCGKAHKGVNSFAKWEKARRCLHGVKQPSLVVATELASIDQY